MAKSLPDGNIPTIIVGYNIVDRVGSGAFSKVYKGLSCSSTSNGIRTTVAIKCIDMRTANSSKLSSDCVISEVKILKRLKHKNIVQLYDFQWDKNFIYLIMEYCGGGDLASLISQHGCLPEAITRHFFRQLAAAIQYMYAMNVAHMDLKPQNILLTNRYRPLIKVSDFGLSQYLNHSEFTTSFRGSPLYMAPEIFNYGQYDNRVDLWSSGVILYECLYGRAPFATDSYEKLIDQIKSHEPIKFPTNVLLSFDCMDLLQSLLVRNPNKRIRFENFFAHPFVNLYQGSFSTKELEKADEFIDISSQLERENKIRDAIKYLTSAVQLYMNCLELFDEQNKKSLREKIRANLEHAECLKDRLRPVSDKFLPSTRIFSDCDVWADFPQVRAAVVIAETAHELEMQERWAEALEKYTLAIEGAMRVLTLAKKSQRSVNLQKQVSKWLTNAEHIKTYMDVLDDDVDATSYSNNENLNQRWNFNQLTSKNRQCNFM
ncbi:unnamed protein product [Dracunculus medinensis]|uniref:non-specific serine/threonine protein kinase n=1 Tax=Dracunculus medinensis TaxID=318479 RepID=A0A0N4U4V9_DRAME|nr:unnamed protein product [Dracunculus medinensis]